MADFGSIKFIGGDARRAHLALIDGGAATTGVHASREASHALSAPPVEAPRNAALGRTATAYGAAKGEAPRGRHEIGVRAVAQNYTNFEEALLPMVLASGVSGEAAAAVADAIKRNPALRAQAERAFQRARLNAV